MQWLFGSTAYFFLVYVLKFALFGNISPHDPGFRLARDAAVRMVLPFFGLRAIGTDDLDTLTLAVGAYCFVLGNLFYFFMGDRGLGPTLNAMVSFLGCLLALLGYGLFVGQIRSDNANTAFVAAIVASAASVAAAAFLRSVMASRGNARVPAAKPRKDDEVQAEIVAARMQAVAGRGR
jgi:hypothetical protein